MRYLLDTNAIIALVNGAKTKIMLRARQEKANEIGVPAIVAHELFFGAFKSQQVARNLAAVDALRFGVLEFDRNDARKAGEIRAYLARLGRPIGPYDVLIAAQAVARDLILVTRNVAEFGRVPGLRFEDWET